MDFSEEQLELLHDPKKGGRTQFSYRLAWTRTYLKKMESLITLKRGMSSTMATGMTVVLVYH